MPLPGIRTVADLIAALQNMPLGAEVRACWDSGAASIHKVVFEPGEEIVLLDVAHDCHLEG